MFRSTCSLAFSDYGIRRYSKKRVIQCQRAKLRVNFDFLLENGVFVKLMEREMGGSDPTTCTQRSIGRDLCKLNVTGAQRGWWRYVNDITYYFITYYEENIVSINWIKKKKNIKTWKTIAKLQKYYEIYFILWFVAEQWDIIFLSKEKKGKSFPLWERKVRELRESGTSFQSWETDSWYSISTK